jgi:hypothetical protein
LLRFSRPGWVIPNLRYRVHSAHRLALKGESLRKAHRHKAAAHRHKSPADFVGMPNLRVVAAGLSSRRNGSGRRSGGFSFPSHRLS